jgi:hypothetical protein
MLIASRNTDRVLHLKVIIGTTSTFGLARLYVASASAGGRYWISEVEPTRLLTVVRRAMLGMISREEATDYRETGAN